MGLRRIGSTQHKTQRAKVRRRNRPRKAQERVRRDARMLAVISAAPLPYTPWVMSWLCDQLGKPSKAITQEDVATIIASAQSSAAA